VISPCDAHEAKKATILAAKTKEPTYIRLAREATPVITTEDSPFEIGKAQIYFKPEKGKSDVGIIATGALVHKALVAAQSLEDEGVKVTVLNVATIKPLDEEAIIKLAKEAGAIVTVEEHQVIGGLGSAVAECLAKNFPVPQEFVGVHDKFGQSGPPEDLLEHYGMSVEYIIEAVQKVLGRK